MALSPVLVIGCGGSGGKVVLGLRRRLEEDLRRRGWDRGIPDAWQLKWIDVPSEPENHTEFGEPLPLGDYVGLAPVDDYRMIDAALVSSAGSGLERLVGWRPTPNLQLPVSRGAGQMRGVGRAVALANTSKVRSLVESSFAAMAGGHAELAQVAACLGAGQEVATTPVVFVVSSMAGGTGAGIFMDVCDVVRAIKKEVSNQIFGFLFTAEIFRGVGADAGMAPNTVASLSELMSGYLQVQRPAEPLYGKLGPVAVGGKSGPAWPYVIGMQPMQGGAPLESPGQCYKAITDTLLATLTNEKFMTDFVNYQVVNFGPNSGPSSRQTAYQMLNQPIAEGDQTIACGVLSSFGSAIVAVGTGKFAEWARDRLARSVVDHVTHGWKQYGRQLMGDDATAAKSDQDVIDFVVKRERQRFIDACGLWEEDEPGGVEHNQVLDGILPLNEMKALWERYRAALLSALASEPEAGALEWQQRIKDLVATRQAGFRGDVEKAVFEGADGFASTVVGKVGAAVSKWLAQFGVPVTSGLVRELKQQCATAVEQLKSDITKQSVQVNQYPDSYVSAAFANLRPKSRCAGDSAMVSDALGQALGPAKVYELLRRTDAAVELLERVIQRVINPLQEQLSDVGGSLEAAAEADGNQSWPDDSGSVSAAYQPSPTEKVLLPPETWGAEYQRLMGLVAGSASAARDEVAAGGFQYGEVVNPKTAAVMVSFDEAARWWQRDAGFVTVKVRLRPAEVLERASQWIWNPNHAVGKFVRMGLAEYLSEVGELRTRRMSKFEEALTNARMLAQPLVRINGELMHRLHPGHSELKVKVACEQFPFPPDMTEAREVVERVMHSIPTPDGGWFLTNNTSGVEHRLMTAVLDNPVQPAAVASLTEPIAAKWGDIQKTQMDFRQGAIRGFWTYNRARLLTESIPLPWPSVEKITRGWFVGRMLGLVTAATESEGFKVRYKDLDRDVFAPLPWPLLYHREGNDLHQRSKSQAWLPALLEHVGLAMMLVGQDRDALEGYEQLYRLGVRGTTVLEGWILDGTLPTAGGDAPQATGTDAETRKASVLNVLGELAKSYEKRREMPVVGDWERFMQLPFGWELFPMIIDVLTDTAKSVASIETGQAFG